MEHQLWNYLRNRIDPSTHLVRVENQVYPGTPDVNYANRHGEGWIELKDRATLPRDYQKTPVFTRKTGLSKGQIEWINARQAAYGNVWIIARVQKVIFFIPGQHASNFNYATIANFCRLSNAIISPSGGPDVNSILARRPGDNATYYDQGRFCAVGRHYLAEQRAKAPRRRVSQLPRTVPAPPR